MRSPSKDHAASERQKKKENRDLLLPKDIMVPNRRESFGRGILKNLANFDENNTISFPLRDNHQGHRVPLDPKKRRVSFAPEVTLHKIESIIPQSPARNEPKRRETIAFQPHSRVGTSVVSSSAKAIVGERSRQPAPMFEIHEDHDLGDERTNQDMSLTQEIGRLHSSADMSLTERFGDQTVDMDLTQHHDYDNYSLDMSLTELRIDDDLPGPDDNDELTMDLTESLGRIQPHQSWSAPAPVPAQGSTQSTDESSSSTQSQRVFGSITSLFGEDDEGMQGEDNDSDMELTGPISPILRHQTPKVASSGDVNLSEDEMHSEMSMDLTGSLDGITKQNTLLNKALNHNFSDEEVSMDLTVAANRRVLHTPPPAPNAVADETEMEQSMDLTVYPTIAPPQAPETLTPLKANRSHTSETGSPIASKRSRLSDTGDAAVDIRAKLNMLTPNKKKRRTLSLEHTEPPPPPPLQGLTLFPLQQAEPEISSQTSLSNDLKSSFTPLRTHNTGVRISVVNAGKVEFGLKQKIPLASSHEQDTVEEEYEYQPVTLTKFMKDADVDFYDTMRVDDDFTVEFKTVSQARAPLPLDYVVARNTKIPWLELYSFSCHELHQNMKTLRALFDDLDAEFGKENPRLVREYYEAVDKTQQKLMVDRFARMKLYSDKAAETAWSTWRIKLIDELQIRLERNFDNLEKDHSALKSGAEYILKIEQSVQQESVSLQKELQRLLKEKETSESPDVDTLIDLRGALLSELLSLENEESVLVELEKDLNVLAQQFVDTTSLENEIEEMQTFVKRQSQDPTIRLNHELRTFDIVQKVSGMTLLALKGSMVTLLLTDCNASVVFDLLNPDDVTILLPEDLTALKRVYLEKYLANSDSLETSQLVDGLNKLFRSLSIFESELFNIELLWPSKVDFNNGLTVEITEFERNLKYKANVSINFDESAMLSTCRPHSVIAKLVYGSEKLNEETVLENLKSKSTSSSFLQSVSSLTLIRD